MLPSKKLLIVLIFLVEIGIFGLANQAKAADCGGDVACACGNTVTASTTLTSDLGGGGVPCTGHGLVVGADNITIDGGGYTITGDGGDGDYGINNSGDYDNVTIQNFGNITNFGRGIHFSDSTGSIIQNNTVNSNDYGIYLYSSNNNTLTGNTANLNTFLGIYLGSSSFSNNLTGNTANSNDYGIYLYSSNTNTLTSNTASSNTDCGIYILSSSLNTLIGNTANSNNNSGIYLAGSSSNNLGLDNTPGTGNQTNLNGSTNPECSQPDCSGIYISGGSGNHLNYNTANSNGKWGILLYESDDNTLAGNVTNSNGSYGIQLDGVPTITSNIITGNTANSNGLDGIYLYRSINSTIENNIVKNNLYTGMRIRSEEGWQNKYCYNNTVTGNTVESNRYGIFVKACNPSNPNILTGNIILNNRYDLYDDSSSIYSSNQFNNNVVSKMLTFTDTDVRTKNVGDTVSFSVSAFNPNGTTNCNGCTTINTSPLESVTKSESDNDINGHFVPIKSGTYSLNFTVVDSNSNTTKRRILFFVGDTAPSRTTYYLRGISPTHGQLYGLVSKSLLLTAPTSTEEWGHVGQVGNFPDETPNYPLSYLTGVDIYSWYKTDTDGYIGVQRFVTPDNTVNSSSTVSTASNYTWTGKISLPTTGYLNYGMDYPQSWYWLALKLAGSNSYWQTTAAQPSYADFTYTYTTTPAVKSISNTDIVLLSATEPVDDADNATIVLENPTTSATSTDIMLDSYKRPFSEYTTTINSDGTTTIAANNISAGGTATLNSVKMDITPNAGTVEVAIDTWNTSGSYYKKWTETGSTSGITAEHTIGDLKNNAYYSVKVDDATLNNYQSNSSGQITFTYSGGYSTKTFEVEDTTPPAAFNLSSPSDNSQTSDNPPTFSWQASSDSESGLAKYQLYIDGNLNTDNISNTSVALTNPLSCSAHTWYVVAVDNAGNSTNSSSFSLTITCLRPPSSRRHIEEKPIKEMTVEELKAKIIQIQQQIIELMNQLIQLIQKQINDIQR